MKALLDLPAELVRTILHTLDPESFYMCIQTSKLFREHALASTSLLYHQISRVPGQSKLPQDATGDATALIKEFSRRATKHLMAGSWLSDVHIWLSLPGIDRKNSFVAKLWPDKLWRGAWDGAGHNLALVEVWPCDVSVRIYFMEDDLKEGGSCRPLLRHVISANSLSDQFRSKDGEPLGHEIVKVAPFVPAVTYGTNTEGKPCLAILYRAKVADCACDNVWMKVLVFCLDDQFGPIVIESFDIQSKRWDCVAAMAMSDYCQPVIVYEIEDPSNMTRRPHKVVTYTLEVDEVTLERRVDEHTATAVDPIYRMHDRIVNLSVKRHSVHLYPSTFPMPLWSTIARGFPHGTERSDIVRRDTSLPDIVEAFAKQSLGLTLASHHHHLITEKNLNSGEPCCVNTALELVISREVTLPVPSRKGAYILKAIHYPRGCTPFDEEYDYPSLHHVYVAQLAGLPDLTNLSSLGLILAISHQSRRIAIASWKTVKIWSLDPRAFLDPEYSLGGDEGVPGDYAFIEGCGWKYYQCAETDRDCLLLEPVELPSTGVVYGLEFRGEDELWGWSEDGLVRWNFGAQCQGKRSRGVLPS